MDKQQSQRKSNVGTLIRRHTQLRHYLLALLAFLAVAPAIIASISAATAAVATEVENGATAGAVTTISDAAASNGSAMQFGGGTLTVGSPAWISRITTTASGANEVIPHGVPSDWDWAQGSQVPNPKPSGYSAFVGWGEIFLSASSSPTSATFDITNFKFWMETDAGWQVVQQGSFSGAAYNEDFSGDSSVPIAEQPITGGLRIAAIPAGRTYHWFFDSRATVPSGYTGNFVIAFTIKQNGAGSYGAAAGGDWWQTLSAPWPNNAAIGQGRMMALANGSETLIGYTNMTLSQLTANHP